LIQRGKAIIAGGMQRRFSSLSYCKEQEVRQEEEQKRKDKRKKIGIRRDLQNLESQKKLPDQGEWTQSPDHLDDMLHGVVPCRTKNISGLTKG
jgi:hypothetical protein